MKVNVGDTIELNELTVVRVKGNIIVAKCQGDKAVTFYEDAIKSVKSPPLKVGDWVTWGFGNTNYEIVAIRGDLAILYNKNRDGAWLKPLAEITRAEKPK